MAVDGLTNRRLRYARPALQELAPVLMAAATLAALVGTLVWQWDTSGFSGLGIAGGVAVGVLAIGSWSLRDGFLQGEPRVVASRRISLGTGAAALAALGGLWLLGIRPGVTGSLMAAALCLVWLLFVAISTVAVNREVEAPVEAFGPAGNGRALVVYHSAHGGLMRALQTRFSEGMCAQGWRVDLSTASRVSPTDLFAYQLLVLGSPCYNRGPARPLVTYLNRVGDLDGIPVVIVVSGFNYTERATREILDRVERAHGRVIEAIDVWTKRPNIPRDGATDPAEIMTRSGRRIARALRTAAA